MFNPAPTQTVPQVPSKLWCFRNLSRAAFLLMAAIAGPSMAERAYPQDPFPVYVSFHSVENTYSLPAPVEQTVSDRLARTCTLRLRYWKYRVGRLSKFPSLRVELKLGSNNKWILSIALRSEPGAPSGAWEQQVFEPGDLLLRGGILPPQSQAAEFIDAAFDRFLQAHSPELLQKLESFAPLGSQLALVLLSPPALASAPRAVLSINWKNYCRDFADSEIDIDSFTKDGDNVVLHTRGLRRPLGFRPDHPIFWGIAVQLNSWDAAGAPAPESIQQHLTDLQGLEFRSFRLKQGREFGQSCQTEPATQVSVVQ